MDFQQSLEYLYGLQRFGIKLGLENIEALLERLGRPDRSFPIVHVAGTNGKGSVCSTLATILQLAGYRVGLYTSPHLHSFTERIRIGGQPISEPAVARLTCEIQSLVAALPATFFEFTTALALRHFQQEQVDIAVLEVGMGGRLDATNAVTPAVCVVTPVSLDHTEHLGPDLVSVAAEKAGIIKAGIPVVAGKQEALAAAVLEEKARACRAPLFLYGRDFSITAEVGGAFSYQGLELALAQLRPGLPGRHQFSNLATALAAAEVLRRQGFSLSESALKQGVEKVVWPGRLEWWQGESGVLLDGAHNEAGAKVLAEYLASLPISGIRWVVGIKGTRPYADILGPLLPWLRGLYCVAPPVDEAVDPRRLAAWGEAAGVASKVLPGVDEALAAALCERRPGEIVLIAGSLFLVAAARDALSRR